MFNKKHFTNGIICLYIFLTQTSVFFSQKNHTIDFQGNTFTIENNLWNTNWKNIPSANDGKYIWMQFFETPNQSIQDTLKNKGVILMNYIAASTYLVFLPDKIEQSFLNSCGVRGILSVNKTMNSHQKVHTNSFDEWAIQGDSRLVILETYANFPWQTCVDKISNYGIEILQFSEEYAKFHLKVPVSKMEELRQLPFVKWVEQIPSPSLKNDVKGRGMIRSNSLDTQIKNGKNYTGEGVGILVRDDGFVGPHIDFQGRLNNQPAQLSGGLHGDAVAGIASGAGNLDPTNRGMAAGSQLYTTNYTSHFIDSATLQLIDSKQVQITVSTYSDGCNSGYTSSAHTVDLQMAKYPELLHVFSAGNEGFTNCGYGAGNFWGNITGGYKQAKNALTVGNVFYEGSVIPTSSKGPAHDGRIKPDIMANGQSQRSTGENNTYQVFAGTSASAPSIAGLSAQLYEVFAKTNEGKIANAALIKASILNSANEAGKIGPDFQYGWGIANGLRAAELIEKKRYFQDSILHKERKIHSIIVPPNTKQLKIMVYWNDFPGFSGSQAALVNDLDMTVVTPSQKTILPWVLQSTKNSIDIGLPAIPGIDHLNNVEQILVNHPVSGEYLISIDGFDVPFGPQNYVLVYDMIEENLTLTYPNKGESFVPSEVEFLQWDLFHPTDSTELFYTTNNGISWNPIAVISGDSKLYTWTVPNEISGNVKIKIVHGKDSDESDSTFSIAPIATKLTAKKSLFGKVLFQWETIPEADTYEVYVLKNKYMEKVVSTSKTKYKFHAQDKFNSTWFAIVAKNKKQGWVGRRTKAEEFSRH